MSKRNQHTVPQAYLRGFAIPNDPSHVWEYDKATGTVSKRPKSVRKICARDYYYAQTDAEGKKDNTSIEDALGYVESKVLPLIQQVQPDTPLSEIQRGHLAFFVGLQFTRGPSFRDGIHELHEQAVKVTYELLEKEGRLAEMPPGLKELVEEKGLWNVIKVSIDPHVSLEPMVKSAEQLGMSMLAKEWLYVAPDEGMSFITSDNPVHFHLAAELGMSKRKPVGPAHLLAELTMPLRKDLALICRPRKRGKDDDRPWQRGSTANAEQTQSLVRRTGSGALRYIYAAENTPELLQMTRELKGTSQRLRST